MVTVVVIAYNVEKYIGRCISSVINQTYTDIEVILVDSSSTDKTGDICMEYANNDKRIQYVKKAAEGPGMARTQGLLKASQPYVTFVDGDDWLEPDAIEVLMKALSNSNADIAIGDIEYVYEYDNEVKEKGTSILKKRSKIRLSDDIDISSRMEPSVINRCRTFTWGKLYKTQFLREMNFKQGAYTYEDVATVPVCIARANAVRYVSKPVYNYLRNRATSLVNDENKVNDMLYALNELCRNFRQLDNYEWYKDELKRMMWSQIRFICIKHINARIDEDGHKSLYQRMLETMKEYFPEFVAPDDCEICMINAERYVKVIKNILIDKDGYRVTTDADNLRKRITIKYNGVVKEYDLSNVVEDKLADETYLWDVVDDMFQKIWC